MAVLQMKRMELCAMRKDRKGILELLQRKGVVEITHEAEEDDVFRKKDTASRKNIFDKNIVTAERALEVLDRYVPEERSLFAGLEGKTPVDEKLYHHIVTVQDAIMGAAKQVLQLSAEVEDNKNQIVKMENQIESLTPWKDLDIPMSYQGTRTVSALIGTFSALMEKEKIEALFREQLPEVESVSVTVVSASTNLTCAVIFCRNENRQAVEETLRANGFAAPASHTRSVPARKIASVEKRIEKARRKIDQLVQQIRTFSGSREEFRLISDYYRMRSEKYEVLGQLVQSKNTFVLTGYVPAAAATALEKELQERYEVALELTDVGPDEEAPVLLKNNSFSTNMEGIVESFGLPALHEIDPTAIMSYCYVFLFGLMLSDAAYGLIMAVATFVALKKFPNMEQGMKKMLHLFMYCGISTLFWGVMFGSYFGDAIDVIATTFFGVPESATPIIPAVWFVPLEEPMRMLIYCLAFGVVHLFLGLALKGYSLIKEKKYMDAVCDVGLWFVFLIGLLLMLVTSSLFASMAGTEIHLPGPVKTLGPILAVIGAVGLLLMSGRRKKNWALRIALGAYDIYNVTGWLSDLLSYSRLLALGLATGVIASVVNQMGSMFGGGIGGAVAFIIIFLVGHTMNIAINLLGAYVHTNRLQYVEFFGKFYEGGGKPFAPFKINTKYVKIKEEAKL